MPTLRRLTAWVTTALLSLQSLQGSGTLCMTHGDDAAAMSRVAPAPTAHRGGADLGRATSGHRHGTSLATTAERGPGAPPDAFVPSSAEGAPMTHHGECPDRESPRACASMSACAVVAALPGVPVIANATAAATRVIAMRLTQPPLVTRAPELPPPRV
jgi:hypothetical protein